MFMTVKWKTLFQENSTFYFYAFKAYIFVHVQIEYILKIKILLYELFSIKVFYFLK